MPVGPVTATVNPSPDFDFDFDFDFGFGFDVAAVRAMCGPYPQPSGACIGGWSASAVPAAYSWAGRPPWRVVVRPVASTKPGVLVTLR